MNKIDAVAYSAGREATGWYCPRCQSSVLGFPALSRADNETDVCSECGLEEALISMAVHDRLGRKPTEAEYGLVLRKRSEGEAN